MCLEMANTYSSDKIKAGAVVPLGMCLVHCHGYDAGQKAGRL